MREEVLAQLRREGGHVGEDGVGRAVLGDELGGRLDADALGARHVVDVVADERLDLDGLLRAVALVGPQAHVVEELAR